MKSVSSISKVATLLADPKRSAMLWALIDGMARPSEELAVMAGLTPSSACAHLARLSASGLLKLEARGRKRYFKLATPEVGAAVEALASVQVLGLEVKGSAAEKGNPSIPLSMRRARLCGDHLGGELAADLYQRLLDCGWLELVEQQLEVTQEGRVEFARLGIYIEALAQRQRKMGVPCNCCTEWSERRPHLGGALGSSVLKLFIQSGWVRVNDDSRALHVTSVGMHKIRQMAQPVVAKVAG
ncbi:ArsR/SmtB family transcription factor [Pseudomonas defluvii]|uniref:ArsR/SmtB family transcription factor n=1 Tax=Pseudomonas defluvii TaxID=1876757 RepID=UPI0008114E90|nr:helix-turn-helix transcriptional regulator [Pseudomonas defluvii]